MITTVYAITNKSNGMRYIGQTKRFKARQTSHRSGNKNTLIGQAVKRYGWKNFEMKALYEVDESQADEAERRAIADLNTLWPNGYNLDSGGIRNKAPHAAIIKRRRKPVRCIETGEFFEGIKDAHKITGVAPASISFSCRYGTKAGGYHWEYANESENQK